MTILSIFLGRHILLFIWPLLLTQGLRRHEVDSTSWYCLPLKLDMIRQHYLYQGDTRGENLIIPLPVCKLHTHTTTTYIL